MSKLDELIEQLCPDGVEYVCLDSIVNYEQPTKYIVNSTDYNDDFLTPVLTAGQSFILGYTNEKIGICNATKENPVIIFDDFTGAFKWVDFNFKVKSSAMKMLRANEKKTFLRYVYHIMGNVGYSSDDHKRLWISVYSQFKIPLPPLPIQEEIVRILDNFTELTARKKQYEYYRDSLLSFGDEVEWKTFSEFGEMIRGNGLQKKDFTENGIGCIHYGQIYTHFGTFADKTKTFVSPELAKSLRKVNNGDLVIAVTSENYEDVCKCVAWLGEDEIVTGGHSAIFKHNQNAKYLSYYFQTAQFFKEKIKIANGTKVIEVSPSKLSTVKIPLPPLSEQQRIVDILDRFDALCNDITKGLPAEIEARKKQYEYYRDKLLTFKELS